MRNSIIDKTRKAYGTHKNGEIYFLGDTVKDALNANMMVSDYEKELVKGEIENLKPGQPCGHPGCCSHISHPCEGCGRVGCQ